MNRKPNVRLPSTVTPIRYVLTLHPDLEGFLFKGDEDIHISITKPTRAITLHARDLVINYKDSYVRIGKQNFPVKGIVWNEANETATFEFEKPVPVGKAVLHLEFEGKLADSLRGFYRARYVHADKEKFLATTQFEATDARAAFPCFDEPAQKAVFDVSLVIPKHLEAISNTVPLEVTEHAGNFKRVAFAPTPKMSTYLLAFIVGEFEFIEGKTKDGVQVRIFVTPGKKHQAGFALDVAIKTLEYFNEFFGIKYPLPNLDMIGIPDFAAGAMENWGAVTYRESQLLVDDEHSSASTRQWTALTVAHELAHQWFGNLVTMEWWTHLWLNEGFASYIEYVAVDHIFPEWEIWKQFVYIDFNTALELDCLANTHPIEVTVHHPSEIGEIFDAISYHKGASVIRMLAEFLGEQAFRKGLHNYLKTHAYKNAETKDLWKAFEKASGKPVVKLMDTWITKPGYPYVQLVEGKNGCVLKQGRFFSSPVSRKNVKNTTVWGIPLSVTSNVHKNPEKIFLDKKEIPYRIPKGVEWIKFNALESTPVRVDYPSRFLEAFRTPIEKKELVPLDRLGIARDVFAFAESDQLSTVQALQLATAYRDEVDYNVWAELSTRLSEVNALFRDEIWYEKLDRFLRDLYSPLISYVGFSPRAKESHSMSLLRSLILGQAGLHKNKQVLTWIKKEFRKGVKIHADLRGVVYSLGVRHGGSKEFQTLLQRYKTEDMAEERNRLARGLSQSQNPKHINELLNLVLTKHVRLQDAPTLLGALWTNYIARPILWEFLKKDWSHFEKTYGQGGHTLDRIVLGARTFHSQKFLKDFKTFFKKHSAQGAERAVSQVIEQVESNILWLARDKKVVRRFLE